MKNKICYIFLGLLLCFSFINSVNAVDALDFTVTASASSKEVTVGDEVTVSVALKSNSAIASCLFSVTADDTLKYVSSSGDSGWNVGGSGVNGISVENSSLENVPLTDGKTILQLKYTVNGSGKITITTKECVSTMAGENSDEEMIGTHDDVSVDITAVEPVDDTTLSNITVTSGGQMLTPFVPNVYEEYLIKLTSSNFGLSITASNPDYQDDIVVTDKDGKTLDPSDITFSDPSGQKTMILNITVNKKTTYVLAAEYDEGLNNSLKSLKINGKTVTLESGKTDYKITVSNDTASAEIEAILADSTNFKFGNNFDGTTRLTLSSNTTIYPIVIEPANSQLGAETITYMLEIVKESSSTGGGNNNSSSSSQGGNVTSNPGTGGVSMFIMIIILVASLIGSVYLYQKNIESYK